MNIRRPTHLTTADGKILLIDITMEKKIVFIFFHPHPVFIHSAGWMTSCFTHQSQSTEHEALSLNLAKAGLGADKLSFRIGGIGVT